MWACKQTHTHTHTHRVKNSLLMQCKHKKPKDELSTLCSFSMTITGMNSRALTQYTNKKSSKGTLSVMILSRNMLKRVGESRHPCQSSKEEYKPWKRGTTPRYYASHTKTMTLLPTRKSVPRSSRQSDHTKT